MTFNSKYQPKSVEDLFFNNTADQKRVNQYASGKRWGNILFYGPKGTGKSTAARIICEACGADAVIYRASEISIDSFNKISNEFNLLRLQGATSPYLVIEEADEMSRPTQRKFRGFMDQTETYGKFILTTNNYHMLEAPLVDRCDAIELLNPRVDKVLPKATEILRKEGKDLDVDTVRALLSAGDGSIRRMMRNLEDIVLN